MNAVAIGVLVLAALTVLAGWPWIWIRGYRAGLRKGSEMVMDKMDEFIEQAGSISKAAEMMGAWLRQQRPPRDEDLH